MKPGVWNGQHETENRLSASGTFKGIEQVFKLEDIKNNN